MEKLIVEVEGSGRHIHLTDDAAMALFGHPVTKKKQLTSPAAFACEEKVTLVGPRGELQKVAVLGPNRKEIQVEISFTDARTLGVTPPVRNSGDTKGSAPIKVVGPAGELDLKEGVIVANRHIHMSQATMDKYGLKDKDIVKVRLGEERSIVMENVLIRVASDDFDSMHIDYDEQNAAGMFNVNKMYGEVLFD